MVNPNEDTEFNDALRAQGILPPKPPSRSPSPDIPFISQADAVRAVASGADADQLGQLLEGDNLDSDDERMFESYRQKRLAEIKSDEKKGRFGTMEPLGREDFVREVTEGSRIKADGSGPEGEEEVNSDDSEDDEPPSMLQSRKLKGTGVVVYLFKDSVPLSQHLRPLLHQLAKAHPETKFLSIPAGLCIPNYPDKNVPTLLLYRNGDITGNVVAGLGLNGMKTTVRDLENLLIRYHALEKPAASLRARRDSDGDSEDGGDVGAVNARSGGIRGGGGGVSRGDDSDSDFDM